MSNTFLVNYTSASASSPVYAATNSATEAEYFYQFRFPLRIHPEQRYKMRVQYASISTYIPNIIAGKNNIIRYSVDGGTNWNDITLQSGRYQVDTIDSAINSILSQYYTNTNEPAFKLRVNTSINRIYITIDSTKLNAAGQLCIDLSASRIWDVLGFANNTIITTDGIHTGTVNPKIDLFGSSADIYLRGLGSTLAYYNGSQSVFACRIPFVATNTNEHVFINQANSYVPVQLPTEFFGIYLTVKSNTGDDIMIHDGRFSIIIEFTED